MVNEKNGFFTDIVKSIDPLYTLPNYRGEIHFHCGTKDNLLPPASCQAAFDACINAKERKLFWHNLGHSMPKEKHLSEALKFFSGKTGLEIDEPLVNGCFAYALNQRWKIVILKWSARA